jgi:Ran GTPase-activating protein (RanGAP) involved in mRNA processing and transport
MNSNSRHTFASSHGGIDPLDHARNLQDGNRIERYREGRGTMKKESQFTFDGVRVDKVINEKAKQHVDNLKQHLGERDDEIDLARKRDLRGSKHDKTPAMMAISSSKLTSPSRGNGKRMQRRKTCLHNNSNNSKDTFVTSSHRGIDPLDHARNLQEGNRIEIEGPIDFVKNDKVFIEKIRKNVDDLKKQLGTIQADINADDTSRESSSFGIKRYREINRNNKNLRDEDLDEIIKEMETSTVLMEVKLQKNRITLADGRFTTALASNTSLQKISLPDNNISDEGVRRLAGSLKVNNTLRCIDLSGNLISKVGAKFLAEALMVNKLLEDMNLRTNSIGAKGVLSLATALKVNKTLKSIDLSGNQISKVGVKFLAEALMVNTSLMAIKLNGYNINDEGAQWLADSFRMNQSLCSIHLCSNRISDFGATKLADAIQFSFDCGVTTINVNGNQVSIILLDRIQSICKAKKSSTNGKELSSRDVTENANQKSIKRKAGASKDDQIASLKEHIARLEMDNARLNDTLRRAKPIVETIDLTTDEAERATKRSRKETDDKSTLAIMYEQNQKVIHIKEENVATKMALESLRGEKNDVEADLKDVKEDLEDANELVGQMSLTTDIWQGRFDELVALVESGRADGTSINAIRNRPLASGK